MRLERGSTDVTPQVLKLRAAQPQVILAFLYPSETAIFLRRRQEDLNDEQRTILENLKRRDLVLDGGSVVERGSHAALLARNGRYASMWRLQQQEQTTPDPVPGVPA